MFRDPRAVSYGPCVLFAVPPPGAVGFGFYNNIDVGIAEWIASLLVTVVLGSSSLLLEYY